MARLPNLTFTKDEIYELECKSGLHDKFYLNRLDDMKYYNYIDTFENEVEQLYSQTKKDISRQVWTERIHPSVNMKDWLYFIWIYWFDILCIVLCIAATTAAIYTLSTSI